MKKNPNLSQREVLCVILADGTKKVLARLAKKEEVKISELARKFIEKGIEGIKHDL